MSVLTWSRSNLHALIPHTAHITHPRAHTEGQSTTARSATVSRVSSPHSTIQRSSTHSARPSHSPSIIASASRPSPSLLRSARASASCCLSPAARIHSADVHALSLLPAPSPRTGSACSKPQSRPIAAHSHSCRPPLPSAARRSLATSLAASLARGEGHAAGGCDAHSLVCVLRVRDVASLGVLRRACRALRVKLLAVLVVPAWVF